MRQSLLNVLGMMVPLRLSLAQVSKVSNSVSLLFYAFERTWRGMDSVANIYSSMTHDALGKLRFFYLHISYQSV